MWLLPHFVNIQLFQNGSPSERCDWITAKDIDLAEERLRNRILEKAAR